MRSGLFAGPEINICKGAESDIALGVNSGGDQGDVRLCDK